jgi:hypothetical protein
MKPWRTLLMLAGTIAAAVFPANAALERIDSLTLSSGNGGLWSAVISTSTGYGYFASTSPAGYLSKVQLNDLTLADTEVISVLSPTVTAVLDSTGTYAYFGSTGTFFSRVSRVDVVTMTRSTTSLTMPAFEAPLSVSVLDSSGTHAIFGVQQAPTRLMKVRLSDFVLDSSATFAFGQDYVTSAVADPRTNFGYFGSSTTPSIITKVNLGDLSIAGALTLNAGDGALTAATIDPLGRFAYFATNLSPAKIIKIRLSDFTRVDEVTLLQGESDIRVALMDFTGTYGYFVTHTSPSRVIKVLLTDMTRAEALTLDTGDNFVRSGVIDPVSQYLYLGTDTDPGIIVKVDMIGGAPVIIIPPASQTVREGEAASFSVLASGRSLTYQWQENGVDVPGATDSTYTKTNLTLADHQLQVRCIVTNASGSTSTTGAIVTVEPVVRVYPNPWRSDRHGTRDITFDRLAPGSKIRIYTLSMHWVKTLTPTGTSIDWNLTNDSGDKVASGYYFYRITTGDDEQTLTGKIAIIR